jgi:hypothetical protein
MKLGRLVAFLKQSDFLGRLVAFPDQSNFFINLYIHGRKIMTYRKQKKLEIELTAYKYLCLFVLGFALGYWCGKAIGI